MPDLTPYEKDLNKLAKTSHTVEAITAIALAIHDTYKDEPPADEYDLISKVRKALPPEINDSYGENIVAVVIKGLNKNMTSLRSGKQYIQNMKAQREQG